MLKIYFWQEVPSCGMSHACCVPGCKSRRKDCKTPDVHFYRWPAEIERRALWLAALKRQGWEPTEYSRMCSLHFKSGTSVMMRSAGLWYRLYMNALTGLFVYTGHSVPWIIRTLDCAVVSRIIPHWLITASDCIGPVPDGEMFTLSVRRQEYLMKVIFYGLSCSAVGRTLIRQGSVS